MNSLFIFCLVFLGYALKVKVPDKFFKVSEKEYPEANGVVIFDSTFMEYNRDGTGKSRTHYFAKVFTTFGKKKFGEYSFEYITLFDTVVVKYARTITPDGKIIEVPSDNITDIPMPAWEGSRFLIPNLRIVRISFPGLEKGGGIEYEIERIEHHAMFDSIFDYWDIFEADEPINVKYLEVSLPRNMVPKWKVVNGELFYEETEKKGKKVYIWKAENVARIIEEPAMPPIPDVATKLVVTTRDSWKDGSRWYWDVCEPKLKPDSSVISTVTALIEGRKTFEDTVRALYEFVNKKIRYVETKLIGKKGGFAPQDISFTLENKYGVCRDKAALLVGLLRTIGIEKSYMVITNPIMEVVYDIPALTQFNHAIVAIDKEGEWLYLDPTIEGAVEFLDPYESDKPVLVSTKDGEDLSRTPKRPPEASMGDVKLVGILDKNGILNQSMILEGKGTIDMGLRMMATHVPKEQLELIFLQGIKTQYPGAKLDSMKIGDPEDFSIPLKVSIYFTVPDYPTVVGDEWHLGGQGGRAPFFMMSGMEEGNPWSVEERKYPIEIGVSMKTYAESKIYFPEGMEVKALPEEFSYDGKYISANISHTVDKNCIRSVSEFTFKERRIPVDHYKDVKQVMEKIAALGRKAIILKKR